MLHTGDFNKYYRMVVFSTTVKDILGSLRMQPDSEESSSGFDEFKQFVVQDTVNHNKNMWLTFKSPIIQQLLNTTTVGQIEQFLRSNLDYCDDCILKMYRRFINRK